MGREKARKAIYTVAGVYLIYLAYTMARDWNMIPDKERIFVGIAVAAFVLIGAALTIWGVKGVLQQPGQDQEPDEQEEAATEEESELAEAVLEEEPAQGEAVSEEEPAQGEDESQAETGEKEQ